MKTQKKKTFHGKKSGADDANKNKDFISTSVGEDEGISKRRRKKYGTFSANQEMKKLMKASKVPIPESKKATSNDSKKQTLRKQINDFLTPQPVDPEKLQKYSRGEGVDVDNIKHKFFTKRVANKEKKIEFAFEQAARTEYLLPEDSGYLEAEGYEVTTKFTQKEIQAAVDITSAAKHFELDLDFGPYRLDYTRNGRTVLLGGRRGHVAAVNWLTKKLKCEINVMESVHDVKWLHNETMFSVAQKSFVYIYDNQGTEIHCIRQLYNVLRLEFLPYHFLLACSTESGHLAWLDVSMGQMVSKFHARQGRLSHMTHNPYNATLLLGHPTGVVTVWSPMVKEPLAKLLCQKTAIQAIHVDPSGRYLVTSGMDRSVNIWDVRAMKPLQSYRMRGVPSSLQLSQRGCLATATGNVVEIYRDCITTPADAAYLRFCGNQGSATHLQFCPYEDVLGVAMERGFASLVVPGSGEPNFDSLEQNPMSTSGQRREGEVKALLEKIQPELITLEPLEVAEVDVPSLHDKIEAQKQLMSLKVPKVNFTPRRQNKKGGGLKVAKTKKILQEQARKEFTELKTQQKKESSLLKPEISSEPEPPKGPVSVLDRFKPKK